jgi:undecaprenyl-diphosphatase
MIKLSPKKFIITVVVCFILVLMAGTALLAEQASYPDKPSHHPMSLIESVVLGITEGLTEYLPISSTGHLHLVQRLMGIGETEEEKAAADSYAISIQIGAILAVLWLYFGRVKQIVSGIMGGNKTGRALLINILAAFVPAVVVGLLLEDYIKGYLFGLLPITIAWFVGGLAILLMDINRNPAKTKGTELEDLTLKQSLVIGITQCIAMWPGVSRSLATIVAARLQGLSVQASVEFSFLLGLVTLGSATAYEIVKSGPSMIAAYGLINPLVGMLVAFLSAVAAVKWMVSYLNKRGLGIFGYYRMGLALVVAVWLLR